MKKVIKFFLIILLIAFIVIQFIRPPKNKDEEVVQDQITATYHVPENLQQILKVSCYDCHSNSTHYPWYDKIQPVAWFLNNHVIEGKKELNFSIFATYPVWRQYKKFKEIDEQIRENDMPLFSYTLLHRKAVLNSEQKTVILDWVTSTRKAMEAQYPRDSLVRPK